MFNVVKATVYYEIRALIVCITTDVSLTFIKLYFYSLHQMFSLHLINPQVNLCTLVCCFCSQLKVETTHLFWRNIYRQPMFTNCHFRMQNHKSFLPQDLFLRLHLRPCFTFTSLRQHSYFSSESYKVNTLSLIKFEYNMFLGRVGKSRY